MTYRVWWKLVGRSNRPLDQGCIEETYTGYGEAIAAISKLLRVYPEVCRIEEKGYWLARRSASADLAMWVWMERVEPQAAFAQSERR